MIRARSPAVLAALALAGCARAPGAEPVAVVEIPAALPSPPEADRPAPSRPPPDPASERLLGHWEGVGYQQSGSSWTMIVDIDSLGPGRCGRVRYPTVPCAAEWICPARADKGTLHAREHLTEDRDNCIDDGNMTMSLDEDGSLDWEWWGSGERAAAHLARAPAPR